MQLSSEYHIYHLNNHEIHLISTSCFRRLRTKLFFGYFRILLPEINEKKNPVRIEINQTKDEVVKRHTTQEL